MLSTCSFWFELVRTLASTVTAVAAVVGLIIAARGLNKWQAEVLADFYEARDIIQAARSPVTRPGEGSTRKEMDPMLSHPAPVFDQFYAVAERLQNKGEFFARLFARRYRFKALFGSNAEKPFED